MKTECIRTKFFKYAALATLEIQTLFKTMSVKIKKKQKGRKLKNDLNLLYSGLVTFPVSIL